MKRLAQSLGLSALLALALAAPASADFGLSEFEIDFTDKDGKPEVRAGSHPFAMTTSLHFIAVPTGEGGEETEEKAKDVIASLPRGFVGKPDAVPRCATNDFLSNVVYELPDGDGPTSVANCPPASAVGVVGVTTSSKIGGGALFAAVYNLVPPPGVPAKLGFRLVGAPVTLELGVNESPPYNIEGGPTNITMTLDVVASDLTIWGNPADPAHDLDRGPCVNVIGGKPVFPEGCPAGIPQVPFLTLPRSCEGPLISGYATDSWKNPGIFKTGFTESDEMTSCGELDFGPEVEVQPNTAQAESPAGLDIAIDVSDEGLLNPTGIAQADIEATEFAFPAGMTLNPSAAEGLGVCSAQQFEEESLAEGHCPLASKLGTLEVDTPVLENHTLKGAFYLAEQDDPATTEPGEENPFDSLLAAYLVIRDPELGVFVKLPSEVETDEETGQVIATVEDLPPFPLSRVRVHLRSGPRAPFITPPTCGTYATEVALFPSSGAAPLEVEPSFEVTSGPGGGPCPPGGTPPFNPSFEAGSRDAAASVYSPFSMRLTRQDGDQDLTRFSATLPPGAVAKLAGVAKCTDGEIAAAKAKTGREEQASPSCPAASQIGRVLGGAGVGSALTYVPGSLYLAGPYNGSPLSVVAIVPAIAGPFDVGTVVTRVALDVNPVTYRAEVNGAGSDPIPHILKGIPLKVRDLRVIVDRPNFTINPTNCTPFATAAQIFGSFADPFNPADDVAVPREARYQAASCAALGFKPKLTLQLKGGTKRGGHPALRSTVTYPYPSGPGYSNIGKAVVTLPPSEFIDNAHINNPCTRVQFNANSCPPGSVLGTAKATSPLFDQPFEGTVYFRSNGGERKLPDIVIDLRGIVRVVLVGAVDTATPKTNPRIRTTFASVPDAPVTSFTLDFFGGKRGLLVNNRNLCAKALKATVALIGQNGRPYKTEPKVKTSCKKKR